VEVEQVARGLWRWTARTGTLSASSPRAERAGVYYEAKAEVWLFDPLVPREDEQPFFEALDRDLERLGGGCRVLLTRRDRLGASAELVERYSASLWAPPTGDSDALPTALTPFPVGRSEEVAFWIPEVRTLVVGEALRVDARGEISLAQEHALAGQPTPVWLTALAALDARHLLPTRGDAWVNEAAAKLRACADSWSGSTGS
jgi:hypothetical protein